MMDMEYDDITTEEALHRVRACLAEAGYDPELALIGFDGTVHITTWRRDGNFVPLDVGQRAMKVAGLPPLWTADVVLEFDVP